MSRISFLFVLLLLSSCWGRHALEVSRNYVPVFNPGGVLFDEDENFAKSYEIYEKRRHDVLQERVKRKKGSGGECELGCPQASEERKSGILAKLREWGAVSRDVAKSSDKSGMVNREGVDLSTLPGARFIDITLEEDDDAAKDAESVMSREESDYVSLRPEYIERESGFPRFEAHRISAREARELGCDCDGDEVRHEHAANNGCDCIKGDASGDKHVRRGKSSHRHAGNAEATGDCSACDGVDTSRGCEKGVESRMHGGMEEVECACEKTYECECKQGVTGDGGADCGQVDCVCEEMPDCACSGANGGSGYWEVNCEHGESQGCECGKGSVVGDKRATGKNSLGHAGGTETSAQSSSTSTSMDDSHECHCKGYHGCKCDNGNENVTGGFEADCPCYKPHECECNEGSMGNMSHGSELVDCVCQWQSGCKCVSRNSGDVLGGSEVNCGCGGPHGCDCSNGHFNSGESSPEYSGRSGAGVDGNECNCEGRHACKCGSGHAGHVTDGAEVDCECEKSHGCHCVKSGLKHNADCCDTVKPRGEGAQSGDVGADQRFEEEQKETIARWEVGEVADADFDVGDERVEELKGKEEKVSGAPEGDDSNKKKDDIASESRSAAEEVVDEFSDGLMEEGFTMGGRSTYSDYNWSEEALSDDFIDLMGDVAFPRKEAQKNDADGSKQATPGELDGAGTKGGDEKKRSSDEGIGKHGLPHLSKNASKDNSKGSGVSDSRSAYGNAGGYVAEDEQSEDFPDENEEWSSFNDSKSKEDKSYLNVYAWYGV